MSRAIIIHHPSSLCPVLVFPSFVALSPFPKVLHAFYLLVPTVTAEGIFKAELLEDFILAMALRSTHLALKLVW